MQMQFISLMSSVVRRTAAVFSKDLWIMVARLQRLFFFLDFALKEVGMELKYLVELGRTWGCPS